MCLWDMDAPSGQKGSRHKTDLNIGDLNNVSDQISNQLNIHKPGNL